MGVYRIYIDEVGNHDMTHVDDPNLRFLSLTGVILERDYTLHVLQPEMEQIKRDFFQHDPDEPIIFHRKELVNRRWPFKVLREPDTEQRFNVVLLDALERWDYQVITVVIDKREHRDRYQVWHHHPYHYCLQVMLERYVMHLYGNDHRGDVMIESRGGREDRKLKESYRRLYRDGTDNVSVSRWQARLTSKEIKVKPKKFNIAGLQLADLIAHPSRREILLENGLLEDDRQVFGDKICAILKKSKYRRHPHSQRIVGYGKKLLP